MQRFLRSAALAGTVVGVLALVACAADAPSRAADAPSGAPVSDAPPTERVAVIGDSLAAGLGLPDGSAWPWLVARDAGVTLIDRTCSGAGFTTVGDCGSDFAELAASLADEHPDIVLIQSSDNDFWDDPDDISSQTRRTVALLRSELPDTTIVGLSTVMWDDTGVEDESVQTSAALEGAVVGAGGVWVDLGDPLRGREQFVQDDLEHPTEAGQRALARAVERELAAAGITL